MRFDNVHIKKIILSIVGKLKENMHLVTSDENNLIIKFIEILDDKQVYVTFAECLSESTDQEFVSEVVRHLNVILLNHFEGKTKKECIEKAKKSCRYGANYSTNWEIVDSD